MPSIALQAIARLRRLVTALEGGDDDARWLASRLQQYLGGAERGLTLDMALELSPMPGTNAWWTDDAIESRDAALQELATRFWPSRKVAGQAFEIHRAALRYAASAWRFDRVRADMPAHYAGTVKERLWAAFMVRRAV